MSYICSYTSTRDFDPSTSITNLTSSGSYDIAVVSLNTCNLSVLNHLKTNITCYGQQNGTLTLNISGQSGALNYQWSPGTPIGDGTNQISGLAAGLWSCIIVDSLGCTITYSAEIIEPSQIDVSVFPQIILASEVTMEVQLLV
ncbi:MAG: SprB repeat-containing protein [Bacteroidetes bacterium]|nr:SprB repeat-containing protein [Bacteroidota bacterium]